MSDPTDRAYKKIAERVGQGTADVIRCYEESWSYKQARDGKDDPNDYGSSDCDEPWGSPDE